jgi:radical SAM superfamily enzyme YgiQ (UPF0313 family)
MTNVLFTNPPWWERNGKRWPRYRAGVRAGSRWPFTYESNVVFPNTRIPGSYAPYPFFMGYAAPYLEKMTGAQVTLRDSIALRESEARYWKFLNKKRWDYVFLESATPSWDVDQQYIRGIHAAQPDAKIVLCGPITARHPENLLAELPLYACIQGEYEKGSVRVLNGESGLIRHDLLTVKEMNAAPHPWFDRRINWRFFDSNPRGQKFPHLQIWSSRGCPFKCIFCVWPAAMTGNDPEGNSPRSVRYYGRDYLQPFLEKCRREATIRSVYFDDDTFNLGSKHTLEMCAMMREIKLPWSAMCRADTIKMDVWSEMKASGCFGVKLGFESGNQFVVDKIVNKHLDLAYAAEVVRHLKTIGMTVHGTFTYGLPGETPEQRLDTKRYIASLSLDSVQESGTAEIEGTPLATLRETGALAAYESATMDENYDRYADGNKKFQQLAASLQEA